VERRAAKGTVTCQLGRGGVEAGGGHWHYWLGNDGDGTRRDEGCLTQNVSDLRLPEPGAGCAGTVVHVGNPTRTALDQVNISVMNIRKGK
jgi:hypothetical protein